MKYTLRTGWVSDAGYLSNVLELRGISDLTNFVKPTYKNLLPSYNLDYMSEGIDLLISHINKNSNILLVVDSDIDGYTSSAMLWNYLKTVYPTINLYYTLHSSKQHGLEDKIHDIEEDGFYNLIICPDSSSNDYDYHSRLAEAGIDCLVIDHHEAEGYSKNAVVINNQLSELYPNKALSGAGVVYKFLCALDNVLGKDYANNYIDLAATGLVGDMMEVGTLENRYIIDKGLHNIKNLCLEELVKKQSFSIKEPDDMSTTDVAFYIVPLVNALIRVGKEEEKELLFKAFIQGDEVVPKISRNKVVPGEYETIAQQNARNCVNARSRQNRAVDKAIEAIEIEILKNGLDENKILLVEIGDSTIDTALTGLLAMKVMAKYRRPVLLGRLNDEGFVKGSLRGLGKGDLPDLKLFLTQSGFFEYCEGHANAAGFSIPKKNIDAFISYANQALANMDLTEGIYEVDYIKDAREDWPEMHDMIMELGGHKFWGQGCPEPLIAIENLILKQEDIQICGSKMNTVRIVQNGITYIAFNAEDMIEKLKGKKLISLTVVGEPNINVFNYATSPQIMIKDYNIKDITLEF